jgi:2-polyprenyl-3-methyl-5-hydroxy-6-metoxy-1,4-benzoquinol methylase
MKPPKLVRRPACALCGSSRARDTVRELDGFPIARCLDCSFSQVDEILSDYDLNNYYERGYGGLRQRQGQEVNALVNLSLLRHTGLQLRGRRLLDIGCGYGFLLHHASRDGLRGSGVELAVSEVDFARTRLGLDVHTSLNSISGKFDLVTLFEVIEHIASPNEFLAQVTHYVAPGGYLCIATDNFESSIVRRMGDRFPKWIPHQHISLFSGSTIRALFKSVGFEVVFARSFTPWELMVQQLAFALTNGRKGGSQFRLNEEMRSENERPFMLFRLRKLLNPLWMRLTLSRELDGEMMFLVARKLP